MKIKRNDIYTRVSTGRQTTDNQGRELREVAKRAGWSIVSEWTDEAISGAKGRDQRPDLAALMKAVTRREVDLVMAWSVDRMGRSLQDLLSLLEHIHSDRGRTRCPTCLMRNG